MKYISRTINVVAGILLLVFVTGVASFAIGGNPPPGRLSMTAFVTLVAVCTLAHFVGAFMAWRSDSGHRNAFSAYGLGAASISTFVWLVICIGALALALTETQSVPLWVLAVFVVGALSLPCAGVLNFLSIKRAVFGAAENAL
ncbi:MAG: hypothetical protein HYX42_10380 [Polaromonas sp.]|uniref:hypothetical protein n=1 Tax=Polaromonas sp. TaxID=1869339 RepID=UPI0025D4894D|nr:hypothetical protein [Polaromonas sp.]MBI2726643.1 hypothetical protein [Polaromonas sp.]